MITFAKSIIAGMFISFGAAVYMKTGCSIAGAILFSMGLVTICLCKYKLFTGVIGYVNDWKSAKESIIILFGNFIGTLSILAIGGITETAQEIVTAKMSASMHLVFIRAIFCGMIIYCCVDIFKKDNLKGILYIPFGIAVFILIGAEHSIADMCYFLASREFHPRMIYAMLTIVAGNAFGSLLLNQANRM